MAVNKSAPVFTTSRVTTSYTGPPAVDDTARSDALRPDPSRNAGAGTAAVEESTSHPVEGAGIEGEELVWEAKYAMKNFLGRILVRSVLTVAWIALAIAAWGYGNGYLAPLALISGAVLALFWAALIYRILLARWGHHYSLTTRRLFVSTGLLRRRRDMLELLRVKDVFIRQTLFERWLSLGTVVVVPADHDLPTFYVAGVQNPQEVLDLIWHHARAERDLRSVKVDQV